MDELKYNQMVGKNTLGDKLKRLEQSDEILNKFDCQIINQRNYNEKKKVTAKENDETVVKPQGISNKQQRKKTYQEVLNEKKEKLEKRKKIYKKLEKKTLKGQPVMRNKVESLFIKIKNKINKGII